MAQAKPPIKAMVQRGGVPHGKCRACGKMRGLYTTERLCSTCYTRKKRGELEKGDDGAWRDVAALRSAGLPVEPASLVQAEVDRDPAKFMKRAGHSIPSPGNVRPVRAKRTKERGFMECGDVTAAGESLGLGHYDDGDGCSPFEGSGGRYATV